MSGLGAIIKAKRKIAGLSLRDFSKRCNLSHTYIKNLEDVLPGTGKEIVPTIDSIDKIARALEMPLEELLKESGYIQGQQRRFNPANLKLIRGLKTYAEITEDIFAKTGRRIDPLVYEDLEEGNDEEPSPFIIDLLAKYANVHPNFFYKNNLPGDLESGPKNMPYHYLDDHSRPDELSHLCDPKLKKFVTNPANLEYLKLAKELSDGKIAVKTIKTLVQVMKDLK